MHILKNILEDIKILLVLIIFFKHCNTVAILPYQNTPKGKDCQMSSTPVLTITDNCWRMTIIPSEIINPSGEFLSDHLRNRPINL